MSVALLETAESSTTVPVIEFVAPMPGFPADLRFVLVRVDESGLLYALTSVDSPSLRFLVVPPTPFFPQYAADVDDETLRALAANEQNNLVVLLVVTTAAAANDATVNLLAPIVVDLDTRRAVQLVLTGSGLDVRAPLMAA